MAARRTALEGHLVRNCVKAMRIPEKQQEAKDALDQHLANFDDVPAWSIDDQIALATFAVLDRPRPKAPEGSAS